MMLVRRPVGTALRFGAGRIEPRVARAEQPWAGGRNSVGVEPKRMAYGVVRHDLFSTLFGITFGSHAASAVLVER